MVFWFNCESFGFKTFNSLNVSAWEFNSWKIDLGQTVETVPLSLTLSPTLPLVQLHLHAALQRDSCLRDCAGCSLCLKCFSHKWPSVPAQTEPHPWSLHSAPVYAAWPPTPALPTPLSLLYFIFQGHSRLSLHCVIYPCITGLFVC